MSVQYSWPILFHLPPDVRGNFRFYEVYCFVGWRKNVEHLGMPVDRFEKQRRVFRESDVVLLWHCVKGTYSLWTVNSYRNPDKCLQQNWQVFTRLFGIKRHCLFTNGITKAIITCLDVIIDHILSMIGRVYGQNMNTQIENLKMTTGVHCQLNRVKFKPLFSLQ